MQGMKSPTRQVHVRYLYGFIERRKLARKFTGMVWPYACFTTRLKKGFYAFVLETLYHLYIVYIRYTQCK